MAAKTTKDSMGWLKLNVGMFSTETAGLSDTHIAVYIKLLVTYWTSGNKLPAIDTRLNRRLGIVDGVGEVALAEVLNEFFPLDEMNNYSHAELDRQLEVIKGYSRVQSERASLPRGNRSTTNLMNKDNTIEDSSDDNF